NGAADRFVGAHVAGVGVAGDLAEGDLLAAAGEEDGDVGFLDGAEETAVGCDRPLLAAEFEGFAGPETADDPDRLLHPLLANGRRWVGDAHLGKLVGGVADAEAEDEAAAAEAVDVGGLTGEEVGRAVIDAVDDRAEADALGGEGEGGEG